MQRRTRSIDFGRSAVQRARMNETVAVILVAGSGTRLGDSAGRPKSLVEVGGRSMLHRAMAALSDVGVEEFVLATGYREELLRDACASWPFSVQFARNAAYQTTQNAISLLRCRSLVGDRGFWKLDGDVVFVPEVVERIAALQADIVAGVDTSVALAEEEMKVRVGGEVCHGAMIVEFGKGLRPEDSAGESIGIERVTQHVGTQLFDALAAAEQRGQTDLYYEDVYQQMLEKQALKVAMADITGLAWTEIDTPEDLAIARNMFDANV